jgi:hypothetical protein
VQGDGEVAGPALNCPMEVEMEFQLHPELRAADNTCLQQIFLSMTRRCRAASLRLDVRRPDHLGPLFGFVGDELAEVGGRAGQHGATEIGKPMFDFGVSEACG